MTDNCAKFVKKQEKKIPGIKAKDFNRPGFTCESCCLCSDEKCFKIDCRYEENGKITNWTYTWE